MRETTIENRLTKAVKALHGECKKLVWPADDGAPDRMVLMPKGKIWFVETKAPGGKVSALQKLAHSDLIRMGFEVRVIWTPAGVDRFIQEEVMPCAIPSA